MLNAPRVTVFVVLRIRHFSVTLSFKKQAFDFSFFICARLITEVFTSFLKIENGKRLKDYCNKMASKKT